VQAVLSDGGLFDDGSDTEIVSNSAMAADRTTHKALLVEPVK
jgi:hypothetical protein